MSGECAVSYLFCDVYVCLLCGSFIRLHHFDSAYLNVPDYIPEDLKTVQGEA